MWIRPINDNTERKEHNIMIIILNHHLYEKIPSLILYYFLI